ncbi:YbfB/YjiJ family MFS transporter [Fodinicola feengrottensis]|uniref:YbfB/YjiJ family MFS transporter n=1 Tax=Fodinicola feengrottensis TaxID=435914 RepID=UPI0036F386E7
MLPPDRWAAAIAALTIAFAIGQCVGPVLAGTLSDRASAAYPPASPSEPPCWASAPSPSSPTAAQPVRSCRNCRPAREYSIRGRHFRLPKMPPPNSRILAGTDKTMPGRSSSGTFLVSLVEESAGLAHDQQRCPSVEGHLETQQPKDPGAARNCRTQPQKLPPPQ